jgi:23S rRNA (adenine2030-N6)-methyltransferase
MKYRHSFHAGNFADVHKHVTLLALLRSLQKKEKGLFYLDTHAGRGAYDLSSPTAEARAGVLRFLATPARAAELTDYVTCIRALQARAGARHLYPGSPLIAASTLRAQDRAVLIELNGGEVHDLDAALAAAGLGAHARLERGDGFERLRALLPPPERRGLTLIDPPYEGWEDPARVITAMQEAQRRFATGVLAAWYPIKEEHVSAAWVGQCAREFGSPLLVSELWLYPRDARVALNGSGLIIANPPWQLSERMQVWLPELQESLAAGPGAGHSVRLIEP